MTLMSASVDPALSRTTMPGLTKRQVGAVLFLGLAFSLGVIYRQAHLNGFPQITHWEWRWYNLGNLWTIRAMLLPLALIIWAVWRIETRPDNSRSWVLLSVLVSSNFLLQVLGTLADPRGFRLVQQIVT